MVFSAGSVRDYVYSGISPFPNSISGILPTLVNKSIFFVENFTGDSLGTSNIADRYFPAVSDFAFYETLRLMAIQDNGVQQVSVGEMSVNNNNLKEIAAFYKEQAEVELKSLSKSLKFFKANG